MIRKHVFKIVVLSEDDEPYDPDELTTLAYDISEGDKIGAWSEESVEVVPPEQVRDELLALGNDGSFFDEL